MFKFQKPHVQKLYLFLISVCVIEYNTVRKINLHFILGEEVFPDKSLFQGSSKIKDKERTEEEWRQYFFIKT